jgi:rhodanese-related sulfurtransferase
MGFSSGSFFMELFLEFLTQQWILAGALAVMVIMLLQYESFKAGKAISTQQLSDLVNREDGLVVDVRDAAEYKKGHIVNSKNIPAANLDGHLSEINGHKEKPVILVCKMGSASNSVSKRLKEEGFTQVYKLKGGMMEWSAANLPLVSA